MDEASLLLSDEFVTKSFDFTNKIKEIMEKKNAKKAELKAFFEKIQTEIKALDTEAKAANEEFNAWKEAQKSKTD
jgi:outer membrane murein-binding lipoprotein Lpp